MYKTSVITKTPKRVSRDLEVVTRFVKDANANSPGVTPKMRDAVAAYKRLVVTSDNK